MELFEAVVWAHGARLVVSLDNLARRVTGSWFEVAGRVVTRVYFDQGPFLACGVCPQARARV